MKQTIQTTTMVLLFIAAILLIGSGCSHESSMAPISGPTTVEMSARPTPPTAFVEDFESRRNVGGWSFYTTHKPTFEDEGGNTDGYLHDNHVSSFAPAAGTAVGVESIFTGDYREQKVTSLGIDLRCIDYEYDITSRYLTLILMNDNGTPEDVEDDWGAYIIGDTKLPSKYVAWLSSTIINQPGWVPYDFEINSQTTELPEGWTFFRVYQMGGEMPAGSWTRLMQNVSYVQFYFGDPELYYILQHFDLGMDNARISWEL